MMSGPILVCGATGQVGAAVGRALTAQGLAWTGLSRRGGAGLAGAQAMKEGDFNDYASLSSALSGIETVFLACGDDPLQDRLEQQMIRACRERGVRHVVKLSAQSASLSPPVSFGRLHLRSENALQQSGMTWTILRPVFFMQSLLFFADSVRGGKLVAATGAGQVAMVDTRDVAEVAAAVLAAPLRHRGRIYTLTGPRAVDFAAVTRLLSQAGGRGVKHISPPAWLARLVLPLASGMPRWQSNMVVELMAAIRTGAQQHVSPDVAALLARPARTLESFIIEHGQAFGAEGVKA